MYAAFSHKAHKRRTLWLLLLSLTIGAALFTGCAAKKEPVSKTGFYFDTRITLTLYDSNSGDLLDECFSLCDSYEKKLSRTIAGSDVWNMNHSGGTPVTVSDETAALLQMALEYSVLTDGKFDCTIAPLSALWDFTSEGEASVPTEDAIHDLLPSVDYRNITLSGNTVTLLDENAAIDLGGIAKGYIADQLKEFLLGKNVKNALINLGGNILTIGDKPDGSPFRLGVQKPFDLTNTPITTVLVTDSSLVSSGVYERFFKKDGKLYHHILDPQTGYPCDNGLLGVTILSKSSTRGDALSTSCFVMGLEEGMALIESLPDTEALFITEDFKLHYSSGWVPED